MEEILKTEEENLLVSGGEFGSPTSPTFNELIEDETNQLTTVIIFVISAVLIIVLIFLMAVAIDCRQQKLDNGKLKRIKRRTKRKIQRTFTTLPTIGERPQCEDDEDNIVENMQKNEPTTLSLKSLP